MATEAIGQAKKYRFEAYRPGKTLAPVMRVTPDDGLYIHTFYDVCPFSPSGRYLAVTRLPFQHRAPVLGEQADVCVIDLQEETIRTVYATQGWAMQLGANLEWGTTDRYLYTNDIIGSKAVCVRIDLETLETRAYVGPKYDMAPDGSAVIGFPLELMNATQDGYGVPVVQYLPPGGLKDQGLWRTDLASNTKTLLVSTADVVAAMADPTEMEGRSVYFFHSRYNPQGTRIMQVVRGLLPGQRSYNKQVFTFDSQGGDIRQAIRPVQWEPGGHHPNWHPDGLHILMNLKVDGQTMRFCLYKHDGSDLRVLSEKHLGSGHPSIEGSGRYLLTDCYVWEPMAQENGEVPIRLLDLHTDQEEHICTIYTLKLSDLLRVDPHPAWSADYRRVCFNGAPEGRRQVFVVDLSAALGR